MKLSLKKIVILAVMLAAGTFPGCGQQKLESELNGLLTNITDAFSSTNLSTQKLPTNFSTCLGSGHSADYAQLIDQLYNGLKTYNFQYPNVRTYQVTYTVSGYNQQLSGLAIIPMATFGTPVSLPMISLQHPTQVLRDQSPSIVTAFKDEELTVPYGMMLAAMGYIVVIPDYPGMGTNYEVHPYCMTTLSKSVIGLIQAAGTGTQQWSSAANWNGKLYLIGFSEGGYATMVTAKELETNAANYPNINLAGFAALDGPYSLSDTMRNLMLDAGASFSAPYFLPYVIAGYGAGYPLEPTMQFDAVIKNDTMPDGTKFNNKLHSMLTGNSTGDAIGAVMKEVPPSGSYAGPISVVVTSYKTSLGDTSLTNPIYKSLYDNDAYRGWSPSKNVLLYHNRNDDLVPFGNYSNARSGWRSLSCKNVNFTEVTFGDVLNLGSVHASTLIPAYIKAAQWVYSLK